MTPEPKTLTAEKHGIDKGDYILVYENPDHVMSFSISWTTEDMKKRDFQKWLENQKEMLRQEIPKHYVLIDQYMSHHKPLVSKIFRYADPIHLSIKAK